MAIDSERLQAELTDHLGYGKNNPSGDHSGNTRNRVSRRKLKGNFGELELETPRPAIDVQTNRSQGQNRFNGFDDKIIFKYARDMTTRKIQDHPEDIYGIEVSPRRRFPT